MPFPSIRSIPDRLRSGRSVAAACALATLLASPAVRAEDNTQVTRQAREHFKNGEAAFKAGRYQDAYREWDEGFKLSPRALFLLNMAHAERRRGELANARTLYKRYLLMEPETKLRGEVEAVLQEIDSALGAEAPAEPAPPPPVSPPPDSATPLLPAVADNPTLSPPPAGPVANLATDAPPPPERPPVYKTWWFWTAVGGAAALGVVSLTLLRGGDSYAKNGSLGTIGMGR
jgi:tetratricopeptide (TPR) repeat protein